MEMLIRLVYLKAPDGEQGLVPLYKKRIGPHYDRW